jgi:hypothetical protein
MEPRRETIMTLSELEAARVTRLVADAYQAGLRAGAMAALQAQNEPQGDALDSLNAQVIAILLQQRQS